VRKLGGLLAVGVVVAVAIAAAGQAVRYRGEAKPGVHVLGADLAGDDRAGVEADVARAARPWLARVVEIETPQRTVHVRRGDVLRLDVDATTDRALAAGSAFGLGRTDVAPVWKLRPNTYLDAIALLGRDAKSASVELHGAEAVVKPAIVGLTLRRAALVRAIASGSEKVDAPFAEVAPAIGDPAARSAAETARTYLSAPIAIDYHGARRGALTPAQVARTIEFRPRTHRFAVVLDREKLADVVRPRLGNWIVRARNARFVVNGDRVSVAPSAPGRDVDPDRLAVALSLAAHGDRVARIELGPREPELTTAKAKALKIRTKLSSFTTEMGVSSSNRIHNVHLMADYIDGTVIQPGESFSFNDVVGERTPERGFLEGQMIVGTLLLPSIGGGVCQTATTLFNNAFELGLPILERHNHSLFISHYPLGRDATVSWGGPDFRFRNDYANGLLIKASYTNETLTFTFYGSPAHRRVVATTSDKTNFKAPTMQYAVDPNAPPGSRKVVHGTGSQGFDVTVKRKVYSPAGKLIHSDTFLSRYVPEGPTTIYGPGTKPPGPYYVIPET